MKLNILDLVSPEKSPIKFTVSKFPDGQQFLTLNDSSFSDYVVIYSRLNSFKDLELIICANQALKNATVKQTGLFVPYFLGARSDRQFQIKEVHYLKQVICPIINSQDFSQVITLDPHSDVLEACLNNFNKESNIGLVDWALRQIDIDFETKDDICLVSPDAGAYKKIFDVAKEVNITRIITANKVRDIKTGTILRTQVPTLDPHTDLKYVIIDDICDGGRTFIELAKAIKEQRPTAKIYLVVTHGIFSSGYAQLGEYFEQIYTTNSVKDIGETEYNALENIPTKVKQLNIF